MRRCFREVRLEVAFFFRKPSATCTIHFLDQVKCSTMCFGNLVKHSATCAK